MCSEKTKDGTVIEEEYFHTSTYKGKPGVVKRNTSGVVVPAETAERRSIGIHSHRNFFHGITCSRIPSGGTILRHWAMIK
ncbi:hypothetical protein AAAU98_04970 [Enterocloster citroniae]|uniref:hypothetical protein n=1 Tax=Enterocloster citroniae TaxID=358743 RepID=UPI0032BF414E